MRRTNVLAWVVAAALLVGGGVVAACGGGSSGSQGHSGADAGKVDGAAHDATTPSDAMLAADQILSTTCQNGQPCGDSGVCAGNVCCAATSACASACCGTGQICAFQTCVTPGNTCIDSTQCGTAQYCDYSLGGLSDAGLADAAPSAADASACVGATAQLTGKCMPSPPLCGDAGVPEAGPITCIEKCEYHPPVSSFTPTLEYSWGGEIQSPFSTDVMMAPIVLALEDTN